MIGTCDRLGALLYCQFQIRIIVCLEGDGLSFCGCADGCRCETGPRRNAYPASSDSQLICQTVTSSRLLDAGLEPSHVGRLRYMPRKNCESSLLRRRWMRAEKQ